MVSALAFAILSDRALVIEWPDTGDLALENYVRSDFIDWRVPEWLAERSTPYSHDSVLIIDRSLNRKTPIPKPHTPQTRDPKPVHTQPLHSSRPSSQTPNTKHQTGSC